MNSAPHVLRPFWQPNEVRYEATDEDLTTAGGLGTMIDLFVKTPEYKLLRDCLPFRGSIRFALFAYLCRYGRGITVVSV